MYFITTSTSKKINFVVLNTEWDPWGVADGCECEIIENDAHIPKQARHDTRGCADKASVEPKGAMHLLSHLVSRRQRTKMLRTVISENTELQC